MILFLLTLLIGLLFCLGQLGRISFFNQQVNVYIYELFIFTQLILFFLKYKIKPVLNVLNKFIVLKLFIIWTVISYILSIFNYPFDTNFIGLLYLSRLLTYIFWGIYFLIYIKKEKRAKKNWLKIIITVITLTIFFSILQYVFYPDLNNLRYQGWDMHYNRLFGLFFDTSIAGGVFGILFFWIISLEKNIKPSFLFYIFALFLLLCGILTFSRNFYFAFLVSIVFRTVIKKNWRLFILFFISFLLLLFIVPKNFGPGVGLTRLFTIQSRIEEYKQAYKLWIKSPIIGIGYNRIKFIKEKAGQIIRNPDYPLHAASSFSSSYAVILVTTGLVGLILFILLIVQIAFISNNFLLIIFFTGLMSIFDNILLHPFVFFLLVWSLGSINLSDK